jgi:hypothetical protein
MDVIITSYQFGKEWHVGTDCPEPGRPVYALIDEDTSDETEPYLVEATCRWVEGHNPPFLWDIKAEDGTIDSHSIAGGHSVYAWRYKQGNRKATLYRFNPIGSIL